MFRKYVRCFFSQTIDIQTFVRYNSKTNVREHVFEKQDRYRNRGLI